MDTDSPIEVGLKAKGIGPKGLRPISRDILDGIFSQFADGEISKELLGAFLMGFRVLEKDEAQLSLLSESLSKSASLLSSSLIEVSAEATEATQTGVKGWLASLKRGEEQSPRVCFEIVDYLLSPEGDDVFKAGLLQGLRVKRETDLENSALLGRLLELSPHVQMDFPAVIDISEPYDGMTRNVNLSLELGAILSLTGQKVVLHGVRGLGPKYGKGILDRVDADVPCGFDLGLRSLEETGLAILDQKEVWPEFYGLLGLRNNIKKRPFLATMEKMLLPIRGESNLLVTGYVHRAYRDSIPSMLGKNGVPHLLLKGLEGGIQLKAGSQTEIFMEREGALQSESFSVGADGQNSFWAGDAGLLATAEAILKFGLGRSGGSFKINDMKAMMVDGRLQERMALIRKFYPEPVAG